MAALVVISLQFRPLVRVAKDRDRRSNYTDGISGPGSRLTSIVALLPTCSPAPAIAAKRMGHDSRMAHDGKRVFKIWRLEGAPSNASVVIMTPTPSIQHSGWR